jgi:hypothetical protein
MPGASCGIIFQLDFQELNDYKEISPLACMADCNSLLTYELGIFLYLPIPLFDILLIS